MGNYELRKIDCLLGRNREKCLGSIGIARGNPVIIFRLREDGLVDVINSQGEIEYGWAASSVEVIVES